jgi:ribosome recycling factor
MSNTKISGVKANIAKWNEKLAIELEEAIATLQTNMSTIHLGNNHNFIFMLIYVPYYTLQIFLL